MCLRQSFVVRHISAKEPYRPAFLGEKGESGNYRVVFGGGYSVQVWDDSLGDLLAGVENRYSEAQRGREGLLLKYHFDVAKGAKSAEDVEFISVADAMEKYSLTRDQLYHYVKTYKITKLRCGKYVKLNAKELSELFNPKD